MVPGPCQGGRGRRFLARAQGQKASVSEAFGEPCLSGKARHRSATKTTGHHDGTGLSRLECDRAAAPAGARRHGCGHGRGGEPVVGPCRGPCRPADPGSGTRARRGGGRRRAAQRDLHLRRLGSECARAQPGDRARGRRAAMWRSPPTSSTSRCWRAATSRRSSASAQAATAWLRRRPAGGASGGSRQGRQRRWWR